MAQRILAFVAVALLAACTLGSGSKLETPKQNPITGGAIATTTLDAVPGQKTPADKPTAATPADKPEAATEAQAQPEAPKAEAATPKPEATPDPVAPLPPEGLACIKKGDQWVKSGNGLMSCVHFTKDSGKSCSKASQCEGVCLARSGTCAPVVPLFGCNEILQDNGVRVTLCIE